MPEPAQPGRARVWVGALAVTRQVQARQRVRSRRRRVNVVIALVKEMLREFVGRTRSMFYVRR
jgi:head-tail adaptor